ncbi:MAG: hypothetical protein LBH66_06955 [Oscillospiraceae bacterium]|jgi:hypothetical protein|nr:hypothetical protein [Oscillospiraceae bacterium]
MTASAVSHCAANACPPEAGELFEGLLDGFALLQNGAASYVYALCGALSNGIDYSPSAGRTLELNQLALEAMTHAAGMASSIGRSVCCITHYITDV